MRIKMIRHRDFTPPTERRVTVEFKAGKTYTTKREWGEALVDGGDAKEVAVKKATEGQDAGRG